MDDSGGDDLDSGIHRYQLRFLFLLVGVEVRAGDFASPAQLLGHGLGFGQGFRVVLRLGLDVFSSVGCAFHGRLHGVHRLWLSMARHSPNHSLALFRDVSSVFVGWV